MIFLQGKYHTLWMFDGPQLTIAPVRPHQSDPSSVEKDGRAQRQPPVRNTEGKPIGSQRRNAAGCKLSRQSGQMIIKERNWKTDFKQTHKRSPIISVFGVLMDPRRGTTMSLSPSIAQLETIAQGNRASRYVWKATCYETHTP